MFYNFTEDRDDTIVVSKIMQQWKIYATNQKRIKDSIKYLTNKMLFKKMQLLC